LATAGSRSPTSRRRARTGDARVRRAALRWLGELKDADAVALLTQRLRDPDDPVAVFAALAPASGQLRSRHRRRRRSPSLRPMGWTQKADVTLAAQSSRL
jgi:hypothetical protein